VGAALALGWVAALSSALAQGGLVFAPTSLAPNLSRMSPAAKLGQLFSITALRGLIKSLLPAAVVAYVSVGCLRRDWPLLMALPAARRTPCLALPAAAFSKSPGNPLSCFFSGRFSTTSSSASTFRAN